jgi:tetratricopeptide (TPR) repeat protein
MKNALLILITAVALTSCKTNNYLKYHRIVNEAEYSYFNEDYQTASELFEKAFKKVPVPFEVDIEFYSKALWEIGEYEKSISLLDTIGLSEIALTKMGFYKGMDSLTQQKLIQTSNERTVRIKQELSENPICAIFDSLDKRDQEARLHWQEIAENYPNDSIKKNLAWAEVDNADSLNLLVVDSLFEIHGFIGGVYFPYDPLIMHLTMTHQVDWVQANSRLFKRAIKQGRLTPVVYARAFDKGLLCNGDSVVCYGQYTDKLSGVSEVEVYLASSKIGVSPYFEEYVHYPNTKGRQPKKHVYYEYYAAQKDRFNCFRRIGLFLNKKVVAKKSASF